jgi:hypothetical protein
LFPFLGERLAQQTGRAENRYTHKISSLQKIPIPESTAKPFSPSLSACSTPPVGGPSSII